MYIFFLGFFLYFRICIDTRIELSTSIGIAAQEKVNLTLGKRSCLVRGFAGSSSLEVGDEITHVNDMRFMTWHRGGFYELR